MNVSRYVKVAFFFIVLGAAGIGYMLLSTEGLGNFNTYTYEVTIPDATGLSTRSRIYLAGVAVGTIREINLEGTKARLTVALLKDVEVRGNARIARRTSSILGTSMLTLDPGTELSPLLLPGGRIGVDTDTADMSAIMGTVSQVGGQISEILREFQTNQMALLAVTLETVNSITGKIDAQTDAELGRISRILESTALITERTERLLASREEDIGLSLMELRLVMENIRMITGEIAQGRGNLGQAVYDDRLYEAILATVLRTEQTVAQLQGVLDNFNTLTTDVDGVVKSAGEIVDRAAGLGIQVDTRANYEFLAQRVRAGAAIRLEPASGDRWYRIGVNGAPDGISSRTVTDTVGSGGAATHTDTTETKYSFSIDAEIARRIGIVTLRGGLLESSAGIGLDIQPLRWMSVSGEVFNFKNGAAPNLKGTLTVYPFFDPDGAMPWHWVYLQGGIYNALNNGRDFFLGGGLRFNDREIKGLVGLGAAAASAQ
ncbi:hypothetical protein FACS189468_3930 [Spirochaetia bacterium]|nr:hypothetical protein FACS189468_3930 [Spirochaetia bacterium]